MNNQKPALQNMMEREQIDDIICQILKLDGPDRHIDGHEILTDFAYALQEGWELEWINAHPRYQLD